MSSNYKNITHPPKLKDLSTVCPKLFLSWQNRGVVLTGISNLADEPFP